MSANKAFEEWKAGAVANSGLALYTMDDDLRAAWLASRKAALEEAAKVCEEKSAHAIRQQSGPQDDLSNIIIRHHASAHYACRDAILALKDKPS